MCCCQKQNIEDVIVTPLQCMKMCDKVYCGFKFQPNLKSTLEVKEQGFLQTPMTF